MKQDKTLYSSYCLNGIAKGCKYCVKGEKLVLFISGICSRNCWYCSLSDKRKNKNIIWANEREINDNKNSIKELINEAEESRATSAGITGGDPLLFLDRTLNYARALKTKFGKKFHIHIYLPTKLVTEKKLEELSKYIDEVRFHPEFIINRKKTEIDKEKIRLAGKFWKKDNIGIEMPMIPDKKKDILEFILGLQEKIGFVNLNEFELSETNFNSITKKYKLNEGGYTIKESTKAGLWLLNQLKKQKTKLKVHLCTADLKNNYQFKNRLKKHKIQKYGKKTEDGTVIYLKHNNKIISEQEARRLIKEGKKVFGVEEYPTFDKIEVESEEIK